MPEVRIHSSEIRSDLDSFPALFLETRTSQGDTWNVQDAIALDRFMSCSQARVEFESLYYEYRNQGYQEVFNHTPEMYVR